MPGSHPGCGARSPERRRLVQSETGVPAVTDPRAATQTAVAGAEPDAAALAELAPIAIRRE